MKRAFSTVVTCAAVVVGLAVSTTAAEPRTLRLDYVHVGGAEAGEGFALDGVVLEGPWPGPLDGRRIDTTGLGLYRFEVSDAATGEPLYSRGFASIFGEWQTTDEASRLRRAFHESVRFPEPAAPVRVRFDRRGDDGTFAEVWSVDVDPAAPDVDRAGPPADVRVWAVIDNGPPREKVDLLLMGDGYTAAEMDKWHADARRLAELLFAHEPFAAHRSDFNVWAVDTPSAHSGVSRPSDGVFHRTALRVGYDAFGSERYVLAFDNRRWRDAASAAPYEFVEIVVNDRKYGGGGIHNLYATVSADNEFTPYVFVHEFGHHFAGLADEYYTSSVAYQAPEHPVEPWERNATIDPSAAKWADLIEPGTPLPTPWPKERFEAEQARIQAERALFRAEREEMTRLLGEGPHAGKVGAFEGALYQAHGHYRPQADCIMFTRDEVGFCAVCRRALAEVMALYAGPGKE